MGSLKINARHLRAELLTILDNNPELNTPEKLAEAIRVNGGTTSKSTLYAILIGYK